MINWVTFGSGENSYPPPATWVFLRGGTMSPVSGDTNTPPVVVGLYDRDHQGWIVHYQSRDTALVSYTLPKQWAPIPEQG